MFVTEEIRDIPHVDGDEGILALVVTAHNCDDHNYANRPEASRLPTGVNFLTEPGNPLQLALMGRPNGHVIEPHCHPARPREFVCQTQEVLIVRRGRMKVDFYNSRSLLVASRTVCTGDVLLLIGGGHGFQMLEETELIEVKLGPYVFFDKEALP